MSTPKQQRSVSLSELRAALTPQQRLYLQAAAEARSDEERTAMRVAMLTRVRVKEALEGGVPARVIAAEMGLSVPRIYQMRAEVDT